MINREIKRCPWTYFKVSCNLKKYKVICMVSRGHLSTLNIHKSPLLYKSPLAILPKHHLDLVFGTKLQFNNHL
jgi:hypothetical protein